MNPRINKVLRDLWTNRSRTILVVLAIAVGVFAFGSVFITKEVLLTDMDTQYKASNPASIDLRIDGFDKSLVDYIKRDPNVKNAQGRIVNSVKLVNGQNTEVLNLYSYTDFEKVNIDKVIAKKGDWPPERNEMFLERASLSILNHEVGDNLTLKLFGDKYKTLKFAGISYNVRTIPARFFPEVNGYVDIRTLKMLDLPFELNQLSIVATDDINSLDKVEELAGRLEEKIESKGIEVLAVSTWEPNEHWGKGPTNAFVAILMGVGLVSLAMSAFLVINTISAVITQQQKQVGIMKAVGGESKQIAVLYFVTLLIYGILGLFVSIPLGLLLAYAFTSAVTNFLSIDIVNFHLPFEVFLMMLAASVGVPLLSGLVPIARGVRVPVNQLLSIQSEIKSTTTKFDKLLYRIRGLSRPLMLSLRNTFRNKIRLLLTLGTLTLAGTLFISIINLRGSFSIEMEKAVSMDDFDIQIIFSDRYNSQKLVKKAGVVPGVISSESTVSYTANIIDQETNNFQLIGVNPESNFIIPNMISGRWLNREDTNALVISSELEDLYDLKVGNTVELEIAENKRAWEVAGVIRLVGQGNEVAYTSIDFLSNAAGEPGNANNLKIRSQEHNLDYQKELSRNLEDQFEKSNFKVARTIEMETIRNANAGQFDFLIGFLLSMAVLVAVVGGLSLTGTMSLNVLERTREVGVMRSVGVSNNQLRQVVLSEGLFVGIVSWLTALPLSLPVSLIFTHAVGNAFFGAPLTYNFSVPGVAVWFAVVLIISVLSGLLPANRAVKITIHEALAYE